MDFSRPCYRSGSCYEFTVTAPEPSLRVGAEPSFAADIDRLAHRLGALHGKFLVTFQPLKGLNCYIKISLQGSSEKYYVFYPRMISFAE